ncbi:hypothetical protein F5Y07DRAFT_151264 [Xylaria sp. FL0933]|nr:hypothetical protein F5Y07DRAFT_151264 [Xylaria sp. FL0933]
MDMVKRAFKFSITRDVPSSASVDFVVCLVFSLHALFWVGLRVAARLHTQTKLRFNDYAICWAMFWGLALAINSITTVSYGGIGHHLPEIMELAPQSIEPMLKTVLIGQFTWALSNAGVKLSIIDLYIKLFGRNQAFRRVSYFLMGCVSGYLLLVILIAFFLCRPFAFNWNQEIPGGYCGNQNSAFLASGILNLVLDVAVILLPLPVLWRIRLAKHKRVGLMLIFSVGTGIVGISIWRTILIARLDKQDIFFTIGLLSVATNLEPLLGICVACLPVCPTLLVVTFKKAKNASLSTFGYLTNNLTIPNETSRPAHSKIEQPANKPSRSSDRKNFERLHDSMYPLHDLTGVQTKRNTHDHHSDNSLESQNVGIRITEI